MRRFNTPATLACVGALLLWSTGPNFIKYFSGFIDSWTQNLLRYSAACLFWMPFLLISIKKNQIDKRVWRKALLPAGANIVMQSLWVRALYYIDPAFMNLLVKSSVIWIAGFSIMFFAEERALIKSKRFWVGLGLSMVGVVGVLFYKEDFGTHKTLTGIIITLAASFMWGLYTVTAKMAFKDIDSRSGFSVICIYTVVGLCGLAFIFGKPSECLNMSALPWAYIVISGVVCIGITHVLYYASMKRLGATIPTLILLSSPFTVLAISHIVFGESLNATQWLFGVILLVGGGFAVWAQEHLKPD